MRIQEYNCSLDLLRAILWQDNEAVNTQALIRNKQAWMDSNHCQFWNSWIRDVFDLNTANEFGLRVWSEILNIQLFPTVEASPASYPAWGFAESGPGRNFDHGNFAQDSNADFFLTTEQKRIVLKLRYFQLVSRGTMLEINRFLALLFPDEGIYVIDNFDMTMTYVNLNLLPEELRRVIIDLDLLPRPAAVGIMEINTGQPVWGFAQSSQNFDNGNFEG